MGIFYWMILIMKQKKNQRSVQTLSKFNLNRGLHLAFSRPTILCGRLWHDDLQERTDTGRPLQRRVVKMCRNFPAPLRAPLDLFIAFRS